MLELVMVIVVMGILAALAIPRMERDLRQEAADNLISAIRYTQHLAMMDDKTGLEGNAFPRSQWQRRYWHIRFDKYNGGDSWFYTISSSTDGSTNVDKLETAIDPANGKYLYHLAGDTNTKRVDESPNIFITKLYSINAITFSPACQGTNGVTRHLGFDYLGRPHTNFYSADMGTAWNKPISGDCTMTFAFKDGSDPLKITVQKETGFVQVVDQNGS